MESEFRIVWISAWEDFIEFRNSFILLNVKNESVKTISSIWAECFYVMILSICPYFV